PRGQPPGRGLDRRVERAITRGSEAVIERDSGGGSRLGQVLGILQVEPSTEREPDRRQSKPCPRSDLSGANRRAQGPRYSRREAIGPHEREMQLRRAALRSSAQLSYLASGRRRRARDRNPLHFSEYP